MSSLDSFLLLELPMSPGADLYSVRSYSSSPTVRSSLSASSDYATTETFIPCAQSRRCQNRTWQEWTCSVLRKVL